MDHNYQYLYILEFDNNEYYVGITDNIERRVKEHIQNSNEWVNKHVIMAVTYIASNNNINNALEEEITLLLMAICGIDHVRGGSMTFETYNDESTLIHITHQILHYINACYNCSSLEHISKRCSKYNTPSVILNEPCLSERDVGIVRDRLIHRLNSIGIVKRALSDLYVIHRSNPFLEIPDHGSIVNILDQQDTNTHTTTTSTTSSSSSSDRIAEAKRLGRRILIRPKAENKSKFSLSSFSLEKPKSKKKSSFFTSKKSSSSSRSSRSSSSNGSRSRRKGRCYRCGRTSHWAGDCYASTHAYGGYL